MSVYNIRTKMGLLNDYINHDARTINGLREQLILSLKMDVDYRNSSEQETTIAYVRDIMESTEDATVYVGSIRETLSRIDKKLPLVEKCIRAGYTEICTGYDHKDDLEEDEEGYEDDDDYDDGGY